MFIFCNHKLGKIESDGYQYCQKCGKAFPVEPIDCQHKFIDDKTLNIRSYDSKEKMIVGYKKIVKCEKCGIYEEFSFDGNL